MYASSIYDHPNYQQIAPAPMAQSVNYPSLSEVQSQRSPSRSPSRSNSSTRSSQERNRETDYSNTFQTIQQRLRQERNYNNSIMTYLVFILFSLYYIYDLVRNGAFSDSTKFGKSIAKLLIALFLSILCKP